MADLMAAFQQNAQMPQVLQGVTPEQFMAIGQLFQSGAFTLPPTVPSNMTPTQPHPAGSPSAAANGATRPQHSASVEREEGELDDDESADEARSRDFLRPPPTGPRKLSPDERHPRGRVAASQPEKRGQLSPHRETSGQHVGVHVDRRASSGASREPFRHAKPPASSPRNTKAKDATGVEAQVLQFIKSMHEAGYTFNAVAAELPRFTRELRRLYEEIGLPVSAEAVQEVLEPSLPPARPASITNTIGRPGLATQDKSKPAAKPTPKPAVGSLKAPAKVAKPLAPAKATTAERQEMLARLAAVRANGSKPTTTAKVPAGASVSAQEKARLNGTAVPSAPVGPVSITAPAPMNGTQAPPVVAPSSSSTQPQAVTVYKAASTKPKNEEKNELLRKRLEALKAQKAQKAQQEAQKQEQAEVPSSVSQAPSTPHAAADGFQAEDTQRLADEGASPVTLFPQGGVEVPQSSNQSPAPSTLPPISTNRSLPPTPVGGTPRFSLPGLSLGAGQYPSLPGLGSFQSASSAPQSPSQQDLKSQVTASFQSHLTVPGSGSQYPAPVSGVIPTETRNDELRADVLDDGAPGLLTTQLPSRKRPAPAAFSEQPASQAPAAKKPFGRNDLNETCIIETSDDEDDGGANDSQSSGAANARGPGHIRDFPSRPNYVATVEGSLPGTPLVVTPGADAATAYQRKMQEVAELKKRMAQYQARKAAKNGGKATPVKASSSSDMVANLGTNDFEEREEARVGHDVVSPDGVPSEQNLQAQPTDLLQQDAATGDVQAGSEHVDGPIPQVSTSNTSVSGEEIAVDKNDGHAATSDSESGVDMDIETSEEEEDEEAPTSSIPMAHVETQRSDGVAPAAQATETMETVSAKTSTFLPGLAPATVSERHTVSRSDDNTPTESVPTGHATDDQQTDDKFYNTESSSSASTDSEGIDLPITRQKPSVELSADPNPPQDPASDFGPLSTARITEVESSAEEVRDLAPELQPMSEATTNEVYIWKFLQRLFSY